MKMQKKNSAVNSPVLSDFDKSFKEALRFRDAEKFDEALRILLRLREEKPLSAAVWGLLGDVYWQQENLKAAVRCFRRATELSATSELASLGLFHTLWESGQSQQARAELDRFQKLAHSDDYAAIAKELFRQESAKADKPIKRK